MVLVSKLLTRRGKGCVYFHSESLTPRTLLDYEFGNSKDHRLQIHLSKRSTFDLDAF